MAKISQILSILSFLISTSMLGGGYFGYKYLTSENFKAKVMNEILENVQGMMPNVLNKSIPEKTGPSLPVFPSK